MGIIVQRHGDVCVTHDILQGFRVHSLIGHPRAEGMPEAVRRDLRQGLLVGLVVLLQEPPNHALIIGRHLRQSVLIEEQEVGVAVHSNRRYSASVLQHPPQCLVCLFAHGNIAVAVGGFRCINIEAHFRIPQELMVHMDESLQN